MIWWLYISIYPIHIPIYRYISPFPPGILEILRRKDDDLGASAADWAMVRQRRCFYETPHGGVTNYDGLLILDNPHWVPWSMSGLSGDPRCSHVDLHNLPNSMAKGDNGTVDWT